MMNTELASGQVTPIAGDEESLLRTLRSLEARTLAMAEVVEALRPLVPLAQQTPALLAMVGDSFDDIMRRAMDHGIDVERGLLNGTSAALRFGASMDGDKVRELEALLNSGVLAPNVLKIIGDLGRALTDTAAAPPQPVGITGLLKALGNPDVQRALGFLIAFAERFGDQLQARPARRGTQGAQP